MSSPVFIHLFLGMYVIYSVCNNGEAEHPLVDCVCVCVCVCANTFIFVAVQYSFLYYLILSMLISLILLLTLFCVQYLTHDLIDTVLFMVIHVFVNGF